MNRIPHIADPGTPSDTTAEAYFCGHLVYPSLPLRAKPCSDCAVECGFYLEYSEELRQCPPELQEAVSRRLFCHQNPSHACKGNAENLGISWTAQTAPHQTNSQGEQT